MEPDKPKRPLPIIRIINDTPKERDVGITYNHPVLEHVLAYGPAGTGKTSLARVVASETGKVYGHPVKFHVYTPAELSSYEKIKAALAKVRWGDFLFIDEIHGFSLDIEEQLYSVLQNFQTGDDGRVVDLPRFTIIGATTLAGNLSKPLRDRFAIQLELDPATPEDIADIIDDNKHGMKEPSTFAEYKGQDSAKKLLFAHIMALQNPNDYEVHNHVRNLIAMRSLGNPRIAKQILKHILAAQKLVKYSISPVEAEHLLGVLAIDINGLHKADRRVVMALIERANKPMGVAALASVAGVSKTDLEWIIEPRLEYCGFLLRTPRGRCLTEKGLKAYGK